MILLHLCLAQGQKIAQMDGVVTPEQAQVLALINAKLNTSISRETQLV
ncbi:MAG: hypothetical protein QNJ63_09710 [Calothrix sp. MO_192.B10]|nr:hypothetical protein [Calothrix sp. MO_192.B10]